MSQLKSITEKKGFWYFCCEHPVAAFFIFIVVFSGVAEIISSMHGGCE
jgi:hypothetical protein